MLILDEPANGLDPAGIRWMRDLLRGYADQGGTVLLSSHLLHEIEVIADDIVMIGNGRIVAQGSKAELLQAAGTVVRARRHARPAARPATPPGWTPPRPATATLAHRRGRRAGSGASPCEAGVALTELRTADGGLEEMFLELTADTQRERKAA